MDGCVYRTKDGECDLRIISKSTEELAKELVVLSDRCPDGVDCESVPHGRECFECWLGWLKQEADKKETEG